MIFDTIALSLSFFLIWGAIVGFGLIVSITSYISFFSSIAYMRLAHQDQFSKPLSFSRLFFQSFSIIVCFVYAVFSQTVY